MNTPAQNSPPSKVANALGWVIILVLGAAAVGYFATRETPTLTVQQALGEQSGRMIVHGVVEPHLSPENLALRALDYGNTELSYFQIRDDTAMMGVYFDPSDFSTPSPAASVSAEGHKEMGPDHAAIFIADILVSVAME